VSWKIAFLKKKCPAEESALSGTVGRGWVKSVPFLRR